MSLAIGMPFLSCSVEFHRDYSQSLEGCTKRISHIYCSPLVSHSGVQGLPPAVEQNFTQSVSVASACQLHLSLCIEGGVWMWLI